MLKFIFLLFLWNIRGCSSNAQGNSTNQPSSQGPNESAACDMDGLERPSEACIAKFFEKNATEGCKSPNPIRGDLLDLYLPQDSAKLLPVDYVMVWWQIEKDRGTSKGIFPFDMLDVRDMVMSQKDYWDISKIFMKIHDWRATTDCSSWISAGNWVTQAGRSAMALLDFHKALKRKSLEKKMILFGRDRLSPMGFLMNDPHLSFMFFASQLAIEHNFGAVLNSLKATNLALKGNDTSTRTLRDRVVSLQDSTHRLVMQVEEVQGGDRRHDVKEKTSKQPSTNKPEREEDGNFTTILRALLAEARETVDENPRFCCMVPISLGIASCLWNLILTIMLLKKWCKCKNNRSCKREKVRKRDKGCTEDTQVTYKSSRYLAIPKDRIIID